MSGSARPELASGWTAHAGAAGRAWLQCDLLTIRGFRHGFTLRSGGQDLRGPAEVAAFAAEAGVAAGRVGMSPQVHGSRVSSPRDREVAADAAWSPPGGGVVAVRTADCLPVLLAGFGGVVAAHAGWRGLLGGVLEASVERLGGGDAVRAAALGPCIGAAAFEVGPEVAGAFRNAGLGRHLHTGAGDRSHACLAGAATTLLQRAGVRPSVVSSCRCCTFADPDRFFSFRRDGPGRGHQGAWMAPQER
ncbi:polyphenol oxidase family protein [Phycisphaera mikurensis]|uniref:Purine nucleoside phosphorylase n=1 Tax=Phycisphaera mikurensis (strain NBRC 102666 / KCTC 22515 / FYK2301M01) TaxID=1142394 RepID=I0IH81_PHYMF|nr:polyphenol oxidase family protein [Phycisphaera mikurensis]MBB6440869.1 hypothetical protein [Phycisphaera mikurensis]BAM04619.1 hypothetical protein PSMK_24600 [Phycisphaera mikurensis NBRC 102666]